MGDSDARNM